MGKGMTILCSPQRKHMQIRQADKHMQTSLRGIAKRARENPQHRFGNLYSFLNEQICTGVSTSSIEDPHPVLTGRTGKPLNVT